MGWHLFQLCERFSDAVTLGEGAVKVSKAEDKSGVGLYNPGAANARMYCKNIVNRAFSYKG